jgi:hypothetical protein
MAQADADAGAGEERAAAPGHEPRDAEGIAVVECGPGCTGKLGEVPAQARLLLTQPGGADHGALATISFRLRLAQLPSRIRPAKCLIL